MSKGGENSPRGLIGTEEIPATSSPTLVSRLNSPQLDSIEQDSFTLGSLPQRPDSMERPPNRLERDVARLVTLVCRLEKTTEARNNDIKANSQIHSENMMNDIAELTVQVRKMSINLENLRGGFQMSTENIHQDHQDLGNTLLQNGAENTQAVLQELQKISAKLDEAQGGSSCMPDLLVHQRDEAMRAAQRAMEELDGVITQFSEAKEALTKNQHALGSLQAEKSELLERLQESLQHHREAELEKKIALDRLAKQSQLIPNGPKICDAEISEKWKGMAYAIRSLAHFLSEKIEGDPWTHPIMRGFQRLARRYNTVMSSEETSRDIWQTCIWAILSQTFFRARPGTWKNHPLALLQELKDQAQDFALRNGLEMENVAAWLSGGAHHFEQAMGNERNRATVRNLESVACDALKQTFAAWTGKTEEKRVEEDLKAVFSTAFELQSIMLCSRAFFRISWHLERAEPIFSAETMEDIMSVGGSHARPVVWVLSPTLYKRGNADGQHYDEAIVLVKADVICI